MNAQQRNVQMLIKVHHLQELQQKRRPNKRLLAASCAAAISAAAQFMQTHKVHCGYTLTELLNGP